jgi:hypothetical protein
MYRSKTEEHLNIKTGGVEAWEFSQQIGTYTKHTSTQLAQIHKHKNLETEPRFTDQKRKAIIQSEKWRH